MEGEEFDALVADIKANSLNEDIVLYDGMILDGRNRYRACLAAGHSAGYIALRCKSADKVRALNDATALAYVISKNLCRRHLTPEQKREVLAKLVAAQPEKADRVLAKQAGVDNHQIARARKRAEATGTAVPVDKRVGKDGKARKQPATKVKVKPDEVVAAAAEVGINKKVIEAHGPQEGVRRIIQNIKRSRAKDEKEKTAAEIERLASKLIELDRDGARTLQEAIAYDDRVALRCLERALARGLGLDGNEAA